MILSNLIYQKSLNYMQIYNTSRVFFSAKEYSNRYTDHTALKVPILSFSQNKFNNTNHLKTLKHLGLKFY